MTQFIELNVYLSIAGQTEGDTGYDYIESFDYDEETGDSTRSRR